MEFPVLFSSIVAVCPSFCTVSCSSHDDVSNRPMYLISNQWGSVGFTAPLITHKKSIQLAPSFQ